MAYFAEALLGNYMAANFVMAADGHGGLLITETPTDADAAAHLRTKRLP